ncbi:MAG TPA: M55 family metallopeptidase [Acidimicrobiales bacterium]|nr:M55 family metallopeptidase [Acidimicrobiales bacterium]
MTTRIFISVDMEGVAGVTSWDQVLRGGHGYPRAQELMTEEANAAIRGAFAGGADEVLVNDSHGTMDNLIPDRLDRRARLVHGGPRMACMAHGVRAGDAMAVFVGYHAPAGDEGVLSHTFSAHFTELRVNGQPMSEAEVNGMYAAALGVPVGVLSGDDRICQIARKAFPGVTTVEVKRAEGFTAADTLAPADAREQIEEAVAEAAPRAGELRADPVPDALTLEVDFALPVAAELAATVPGSRRVGGRTLAREVEGAEELVSLVMAWYYLASIGVQQRARLFGPR